MELFNGLAIKLIKYKWVIFCGICALAVGILTYTHPIAKGDNILYLLSSISQGLAAIFALVFTITIFGAQMMQKFTAVDKMIDGWTKALMIIFAIGILLPLIQLEADYNVFNFDNIANLSLAVDLSIATFCVLAIIPYLTRVNRIIKYEGGISKLSESVSEAIDSDYKTTASNKISELVELGISAVNEMFEDDATKIVNKLKSAGKEVVNKGRGNVANMTYDTFGEFIEELANIGWGEVVYSTIDGLHKIGLKSVEKRLDRTTKEVLEALKEIGVKVALREIEVKAVNKAEKAELIMHLISKLEVIGILAIDSDLSNDTVSLSSDGLQEIGTKVAKKWGSDILLKHSILIAVLNLLEEIANEAYETNRTKFANVCESSLKYLWIIGMFIKKNRPDYAEDLVSEFKNSNKNVMKEFGNEVIRSKARESVRSNFPGLIDELKGFEELYDKSDAISL